MRQDAPPDHAVVQHPKDEDYCVVFGGSWINHDLYIRGQVFFTGCGKALERMDVTGFRCYLVTRQDLSLLKPRA